jgi:hypothetical protein
MARGDKTGPSGAGPKTGRGMGYCAGNEHPGYMNMPSNWGAVFGRRIRGGGGGYRTGFGFRHGYRHFQPGNMTDVPEKTLIENEIRILKDQLSALEDRLSKTNNS